MKIGNVEVYGIIYKITNLINGKIYIGQTVKKFKRRYTANGEGIERVYNHHLNYKNNNRYYNTHLVNAIKKYGFDAFEVIEIFDIAFSKKELDIKEIYYIEKFDCIKNGYNRIEGGGGVRLFGEDNPFYGMKHSEKSREKISKHHADVKGKNNPKAKESVICLTTKRIFFTASEASEYYKLNNKCAAIRNCCKGYNMKKNEKIKVKSAGKLPNGTPLIWRFVIWKHNKRYRIKNL